MTGARKNNKKERGCLTMRKVRVKMRNDVSFCSPSGFQAEIPIFEIRPNQEIIPECETLLT